MGAYYTDVSHCRKIRKLLKFPEGEEVSVLEPSIGDGSAVVAVTGAETNRNIKIFGVELNDAVARQVKANPLMTHVLKADFTDGVIIRRNCFSFAFGNPPYLTEVSESGETKERLERVFLEKLVNYLRIDAVLVWVIPYSSFVEKSYLRLWMRDFDTEAIYKFSEPEYSKWHQIVIIGRKTKRRFVTATDAEEFFSVWHLDDLGEIPDENITPIEVYPSKESEVDLFAEKVFNASAAFEKLKAGLSSDITLAFDKRVSQKRYTGGELLRPPIALKKDSKYLLVTSGFTDGMVGNAADGTLHMMRGCANVVESSNYDHSESEEESSSGTITVTSCTEVEIRVLESDGTLTLLK